MDFMMNTKINTFESDMEEVLNSLSIIGDVVRCQRISEPTPAQIKFSIEEAIRMARENELTKYIIDARGTFPPNAELRQVLRQFLSFFIGHFDAMVIVIDENPTLKVSTRFIFHNHDLPENMHFHICTSEAEGMAFLEKH